jgi:hypothetical protein
MKGRPRVGLLWFVDSAVLFKIAGAVTVASTAILYSAVKYEKCEPPHPIPFDQDPHVFCAVYALGLLQTVC